VHYLCYYQLLTVFLQLLAYCILGFAVVDIKLLGQYGDGEASGTFAGDVIIICASLLLIAVAALGVVGGLKGSIKMLYMVSHYRKFSILYLCKGS
jgi:hypothetical protein